MSDNDMSAGRMTILAKACVAGTCIALALVALLLFAVPRALASASDDGASLLEQVQDLYAALTDPSAAEVVFATAAVSEPVADYSWYSASATDFAFANEGSGKNIVNKLIGLRNIVAGTVSGISADSFAGKTITLSGAVNLAGLEWTPIGSTAHPFDGTFDGGGFTITGFVVSTTYSDAGFFGVTGTSSEIRNVNVAAGTQGEIRLGSESAAYSAGAIGRVGTLVGNAQGKITACSSGMNVAVFTETEVTSSLSVILDSVGGLAGRCSGDMSACTYTGSLSIESGTSTDTDDPLMTCIGGVVGFFGNLDNPGSTTTTVSSCSNSGSVKVKLDGSAADDRFGVDVNAQAANIGGVVGYSTGSVVSCSNSGSVDTSYQLSKTFTASSTDASNITACGTYVGGVVGGLRSEVLAGMTGLPADAEDAGTTAASNLVSVSKSYNTGSVFGHHSVGGILGSGGWYSSVDSCYNSIPLGNATIPTKPERQDGQSYTEYYNSQEYLDYLDELYVYFRDVGGVKAARWNKPMGGGIAGKTYGNISYCYNTSRVWSTTDAGYYIAGIAGCVFVGSSIEGYEAPTPEVWACYNTGFAQSGLRAASLIGDNEGYVHDCYALTETSYHSSSSSERLIYDGSDSSVRCAFIDTVAELSSADAVADLNHQAASEGWATYFTQAATTVNDGMPVLEWQDSGIEPVDLTAAGSSLVLTLERDADYDGTAVVPTLSATYTAAGQTTTLVQGADFKVVVDPSATERTLDADRVSGTRPYTATIQGLGRYIGSPSASVSYGIVIGDLSSASYVIASKTYTGSAVTLSADDVQIVSPTGVVVSPDTYTFTVNDGQDCIERGSYLITATAAGGEGSNYQGTLSDRAFVIEPADLYRACTVEGISSGSERYAYTDNSKYVHMRFTYTGSEIHPTVDAVTYTPEGGSKLTLTQGTSATDVDGDYNVKYTSDGDYTNVTYDEDGAYTELSMIIESNNSSTIGNYHNYVQASFTIVPADISSADILVPDQAHTGAARGNCIVTFNGKQLVEGTDYTVTYRNNINVGTATAIIVGKGNFIGTSTKTYKILDAEATNISTAVISDIDPQGWTGEQVMPDIVAKDTFGNTLVEGKDYIVTYSDNVDAGTGKATIVGVGTWSGSVVKTFSIVKHTVSVAPGFGRFGTRYTTNTVNGTSAKIDGNTTEDTKPKVDAGLATTVELVIVRSTGFSQDCNLTGVVVKGDSSGSTIPVTVKSLENDTSSSGTNRLVCTFAMPDEDVTVTSLSYTTATKDLSSCTIADIADQDYTGAAIKPSIVVSDGTTTLEEGVDYGLFSYSYADNIEPGTATVTAVGMGSYKGSISASFVIKPAGEMTVSAEDVSVVYDGVAHGLVATASVSGATILYGTSADSCTLDSSPTFTDVGEHIVYFTATAPGMRASGSAKVVIEYRQATVAANAAIKGYGGSDPVFSATVTGVLPADEGTISYTVSRPGAGTDEAIGTYEDAIVATGPTMQGNYRITYVAADFTISKDAPLEVSAPDVEVVYDAQEHGVVATATVAGAVIRYGDAPGDCTMETSPVYTEAGTYTVYFTATTAAGMSASGSANVVISKAPLTLRVGALSKTYGDANPDTSGVEVTVAGLVGGDTLASLGGTSVVILGVDAASPAGTYAGAIRAGIAGAEPANYEVQDGQADFVVEPRDLSECDVTVSALKNWAYTGSSITPIPDVTIDGKSAQYSESATSANPRTFTVSYADSKGNETTPVEQDYYTVYVLGSGNYTGRANVTTSFYIYDDSGSTTDGWHILEDGSKAYYRDGQKVKGEFIKLYKDSGELVSDSDAPASSYNVYYLKSDGAMVTGLARIYGYFRYFGADGIRRYGAQNVVWSNVINDDGTHTDGLSHEMYFDDSGERPTGIMRSGYVKIYKDGSGCVPADAAAKMTDDSAYNVYYYRINGAKLYGLAKIYGYWRYLDPTTGVRQYGRQSVVWENVTNDDEGNLAHNDGLSHEMFFEDAGSFPNGIMASGVFVRLNADGASDSSSSSVYYFKIRGDMAYGLVKVYGYWRYFGSDGVRRYGWQVIDGKTYYFDTYTGAAYTGTRTIDGAIYTFDANGVLQ